MVFLIAGTIKRCWSANPITTPIFAFIKAECGGPMKQAIPPRIPGSMANRNNLSCCRIKLSYISIPPFQPISQTILSRRYLDSRHG